MGPFWISKVLFCARLLKEFVYMVSLACVGHSLAKCHSVMFQSHTNGARSKDEGPECPGATAVKAQEQGQGLKADCPFGFAQRPESSISIRKWGHRKGTQHFLWLTESLSTGHSVCCCGWYRQHQAEGECLWPFHCSSTAFLPQWGEFAGDTIFASCQTYLHQLLFHWWVINVSLIFSIFKKFYFCNGGQYFFFFLTLFTVLILKVKIFPRRKIKVREGRRKIWFILECFSEYPTKCSKMCKIDQRVWEVGF